MPESKQRYEVEILSLLRFVLAVSVLAQHMWPSVAPDSGRHAVVGFFCISGFLITRISLTSYRNRPGAFLLNRFLRIYPQYILAVVLGGIVVLVWPVAAQEFNPVLRWPATALDWARQVFIIGLNGAPVRLSPPTWSLNLEIYFYLIIGLITYRSERLTYAALGLSSGLGIMALLHVGAFEFYGTVPGNAFIFFLGSAAYFLSQRLRMPSWIAPIALAGYAFAGFIAPMLLKHHPHFIDSLLVVSALMTFLVLLKMPVIRTANRRVIAGINFLGRVSYPLFLIHWAATTPLYSIIGHREPDIFLGGLICSLLVASLMVFAVDRPVEIIRTRIRKSQSISTQPKLNSTTI